MASARVYVRGVGAGTNLCDMSIKLVAGGYPSHYSRSKPVALLSKNDDLTLALERGPFEGTVHVTVNGERLTGKRILQIGDRVCFATNTG